MKKRLLIFATLLFATISYSQILPKMKRGGMQSFSNSDQPFHLSTMDDNLVIQQGATINVFKEAALTVHGSIKNLGEDYNFVVESDGNIIQIDDSSLNQGFLLAKRDIKVSSIRQQYNYLGSPVTFASGQNFKTIYPGITHVLYYNEGNSYFYQSSGANIPGRALALKEPSFTGFPAGSKITASYKGIPQNGEIILPIVNTNSSIETFGYNLVGNPYASNIDLLKLYNINGGNTEVPTISPNISPTFYFWDNNNNALFVQQGINYQGAAYALFNVLAGSGGTGVGTQSELNAKVPTNIVKVAQGFMTQSLLPNYQFKFNNSIRTNNGSAIDFHGKNTNGQSVDRYWIQMKAPSHITSTLAVVHYAAGNNLYGLEDSRSLLGSDAIYSTIDQEKLAINSRFSLAETDIIPLGMNHYVTGIHTVSLLEKEGIFANGQNIYLKDKQTGIITNLSEVSYTFTANAGENTDRFEIIYKPETVLVTDAVSTDQIVVYRDRDNFVVKAESKKITTLDVFDGVGRLVYSVKPNAVKVMVPTDLMLNGVYLLKIDQGGIITSKKVIR